MANAPKRAAVAARGVELLKLIAASPNGSLMLTQDEGAAIVAAGQAVVDSTVIVGDTASVSLTDAGKAAIAAAPKILITSDIPVPEKKRATRKEIKYPIDALEVGQSFHIPATAENPDPAASIQSTISNYRAKYGVDMVDDQGNKVMETVKVREYERDADGKLVKDAEGHRVLKSEAEQTRVKKIVTRDFIVASVNASDPGGVGARVWRSK